MGNIFTIPRLALSTSPHFLEFVEAALMKRMTTAEIAASFGVPLRAVERAAAQLGPIPVHSPVALRNLSAASAREANPRRAVHGRH